MFLAQLVNIIAEAERGDYDGSMRDLKAYLGATALRAAPASQIPARTLLTIGEAYFRRLVQGRRFDLAREVCDVITKEAVNPAVRDHFAGYRRRLDLVGRPAPAIRGTDVDGAEVRLDDLKDKVVLVVFWATWCNPCVERIPILNRALELYEKDGFAILGVNLDSGPDRERLVRRFVVEFGVPWPNVLSGEGEHDIAGSYAVSEIPANVLIGRDGKVVTFDLGGADLLQAVSQAVRPPRRPRLSSRRARSGRVSCTSFTNHGTTDDHSWLSGGAWHVAWQRPRSWSRQRRHGSRLRSGSGLAYPGVPFLYYTPQSVPSPTEYLYDRANARISAYGNAVQQQAAASQMASAATTQTPISTASATTRERKLTRSRRVRASASAPPPRCRGGPRRLPRRSSPHRKRLQLPLDAFFLPSGELDWPRDAPDSEVLRPARAEAEMAVKAVRSEIRSVGKAKAQSVGTAKWKLVNYGQRALLEVKSDSLRGGDRRLPLFPAVPPPGAGSGRYRRILSRGEGEMAGDHAR